jgi:hypothetical protein
MDVEKLMKELPTESGSSVTYEEVEAVLGIRVTENRFRTVTGAWRKKLFRDKNLQTAAEGGAFHFLTANQAFDTGVKSLHKIGKAAGRLHVRAGTINTNDLTTERKEKHRLLVRETQAVIEATRNAAKQIAGPKPVQSNVRMVS